MTRSREKWGPHLNQAGWVVVPGEPAAPHLLGGQSWRILGAAASSPAPCLLLSLDNTSLAEPRLGRRARLPLALYLNCDLGAQAQEYHFHEQTRQIDWLVGDCALGRPLPAEDRLPEPLPERHVSLRPCRPEELPTDEERYWSACDSFLGGGGALRVLGAPVWLGDPMESVCDCGKHMRYVASLGYEAPGEPSLLLAGEQALFLGEMAFYFFLCDACCRVRVLSQAAS